MDIKEGIMQIATEKGELFIRARDKKHAESMRVTAFNLRRQMPQQIVSDVGIQIFEDGSEEKKFFLRLFDRKIDGAEIWVRGEDGKLIPAIATKLSNDASRTVSLMFDDGLSIEEILANLPDESEALVRAAFDRLK